MQIRGLQQGFLNASTTDGLGPDDCLLYGRVPSCALEDSHPAPTCDSEKCLQTLSDVPWGLVCRVESRLLLTPIHFSPSVICWGVHGLCRQVGKELLQKQVGSYRHPGLMTELVT